MSDLAFGVATGAHRRIDGDNGAPVEYDLRTGPELAAMRMDDHQARIAALEARLRHVEQALAAPSVPDVLLRNAPLSAMLSLAWDDIRESDAVRAWVAQVDAYAKPTTDGM